MPTIPPSAWIRRWAHLAPTTPASSTACDALDVACGGGRHALWLHARGFRVHAVDRDAAAIAALRRELERQGAGPGLDARVLCRDIEQGPWPYAGQRFGLVVITRYLWRPLLPVLVASLAPGGVLLYETFTREQRRIGRPDNPDFLLCEGELLDIARAARLRVVAYEDGYDPAPPPRQESPDGKGGHDAGEQPLAGRFVQRIAAMRQDLDPGLGADSGHAREPWRPQPILAP